jgi:hypothetical protein
MGEHGKCGDTFDQHLRALLVIPSAIDAESDRYDHKVRYGKKSGGVWSEMDPCRPTQDVPKRYAKTMGWPTSSGLDCERSFSTTISDKLAPVAPPFTHLCILSFRSGDRSELIYSARRRRRHGDTIVRGRKLSCVVGRMLPIPSSSSFFIQKYLFFVIDTSLLRLRNLYLVTTKKKMVRRFIKTFVTLIRTT